MKNIIFVTDFDAKGSGYKNIAVPLLNKMMFDGHNVIVLGSHYSLIYENSYIFHLIPIMDTKDCARHISRLENEMKIDIIIIASDLLYHRRYLETFEQTQIKTPVVAIFPVESPPMTFSWMLPMIATEKCFCYSKFGTQACVDLGFDVTYLPVGIDRGTWRKYKDKIQIHQNYGKTEKDFIILTVADNQERKNLTASMDIVKKIQDKCDKYRILYYLVTRENNLMGYALRDYSNEIGLQGFEIIERGMDEDRLCEIYNLADLFLLTSKAEGLGLPVLEAMSCGIPVAGTDACAIKEHLQEGKSGIPLPIAYQYRDMYNNGWRYLVDTNKSADLILDWINNPVDFSEEVEKYLEDRTFDNSYKVLMNTIFGDENG